MSKEPDLKTTIIELLDKYMDFLVESQAVFPRKLELELSWEPLELSVEKQIEMRENSLEELAAAKRGNKCQVVEMWLIEYYLNLADETMLHEVFEVFEAEYEECVSQLATLKSLLEKMTSVRLPAVVAFNR